MLALLVNANLAIKMESLTLINTYGCRPFYITVEFGRFWGDFFFPFTNWVFGLFPISLWLLPAVAVEGGAVGAGVGTGGVVGVSRPRSGGKKKQTHTWTWFTVSSHWEHITRSQLPVLAARHARTFRPTRPSTDTILSRSVSADGLSHSSYNEPVHVVHAVFSQLAFQGNTQRHDGGV